MFNKEEIIKQLLDQGYPIILDFEDSPGREFPDHDHKGDQLMFILEGSIVINLNGQTHLLKAGDQLSVPAHAIHSAKVVPDGCKYVVGETAP